FQKWTARSSPAEIRVVPSGVASTHSIGRECPERVCTCFPTFTSKTAAVLSGPGPTSRLPSGDQTGGNPLVVLVSSGRCSCLPDVPPHPPGCGLPPPSGLQGGAGGRPPGDHLPPVSLGKAANLWKGLSESFAKRLTVCPRAESVVIATVLPSGDQGFIRKV